MSPAPLQRARAVLGAGLQQERSHGLDRQLGERSQRVQFLRRLSLSFRQAKRRCAIKVENTPALGPSPQIGAARSGIVAQGQLPGRSVHAGRHLEQRGVRKATGCQGDALRSAGLGRRARRPGEQTRQGRADPGDHPGRAAPFVLETQQGRVPFAGRLLHIGAIRREFDPCAQEACANASCNALTLSAISRARRRLPLARQPARAIS